MKFNRIVFLLFIVVLALPLSHCGGGGMESALSSMYLPVNVGDVHNLRRTNMQGMTADFQETVEAPVDLNGTQVFPFTTRDSNGNLVRIDYHGTDISQGVSICGFDDVENNATARYTPCLFFPALMMGQSRSGTVSVTGTGLLANAMTADYTDNLESFGTVQVPAGTFSNCAVNAIDVNNKDAKGNTVEQGTFTITLCPDVGGVRLSHTGLSFGSATSELTSAIIGGRSFP